MRLGIHAQEASARQPVNQPHSTLCWVSVPGHHQFTVGRYNAVPDTGSVDIVVNEVSWIKQVWFCVYVCIYKYPITMLCGKVAEI